MGHASGHQGHHQASLHQKGMHRKAPSGHAEHHTKLHEKGMHRKGPDPVEPHPKGPSVDVQDRPSPHYVMTVPVPGPRSA